MDEDIERFFNEIAKHIVKAFPGWRVGSDPTHRPTRSNGPDSGEPQFDFSGRQFDADACEIEIIDGRNLHDNCRDLAASLARRGLSVQQIIDRLRSLLMLCRPQVDPVRWQERYDYVPELARSAVRKFPPSSSSTQPESEQAAREQPGHNATAFTPIAAIELPSRQWLWRGHYLRGAVSCTIAGGGFGKSALALYEAFRMAEAGRNVWYITGEEDVIEVQRRLAALSKQFHVDLSKLEGKLFIDDRDSFPLKFASSRRDGTVYEQAAFDNFERNIRDNKIDVVILDPLVEFHNMNENDNVGLAGLVYRLRSIARRVNCAIELVHHVRKPPSVNNSAQLTVDDARGGGALINATRSARVLNKMTASEAQLANIATEIRYRYIKLDNPKRNYMPPEQATWFVLNPVMLDNGDNVQAIDKYEFPTALAEATVNLLDQVVTWLAEKPYRKDSQSPDWLGKPIALRLGLGLDGDAAEAAVKRINRMLKAWVLAGKIEVRHLPDENRKPRPHYVLPKHRPNLNVVDPDEPPEQDD